MDPSRFDHISRLFADRRLSRRQTMQGAGVLAAGTLATAGLTHAAAQEATPAASPVAGAETEKVSFLFVQTFGEGSIAEAENGNLTLTADHLAGQTIYFSDRPERIVGMVSTEHLLGLEPSQTTTNFPADATPIASPTADGELGFTPANPPNAALVFSSPSGDTKPGEVLVVELIDPTYDSSTGKATYEIKVLANDSAIDMTLLSEPVSAADALRSFDAASLFIDDCGDMITSCYGYVWQTGLNDNYLGDVHSGFCWDWGKACCAPCDGWAAIDCGNCLCEAQFGVEACSGGTHGQTCGTSTSTPAFNCG